MKIFGSFNMPKQDAHDKRIRQKLSEHNVEPPAGLWERIEAELPPEGARVLPIANVLFQVTENEHMRQTLNAHEEEPPAFLWDRIESQLPEERRRRFGVAWYAVPMAASIIGLAVYLGVNSVPENTGSENTGIMADSRTAQTQRGSSLQSAGQSATNQTSATTANAQQNAVRMAPDGGTNTQHDAGRVTQDAGHSVQHAARGTQNGDGNALLSESTTALSSARYTTNAGRRTPNGGRRTQDAGRNSQYAGRTTQDAGRNGSSLPPAGSYPATAGVLNANPSPDQENTIVLTEGRTISRVGSTMLAQIPMEEAGLPEKWRKKTLPMPGREKPGLRQDGPNPLRNPNLSRWSVGFTAMGGTLNTEMASNSPTQPNAYAAEDNAQYSSIEYVPGSIAGGGLAARFNISKRLSVQAGLGMQWQTINRPIRLSPYRMEETPNKDVIEMLADYTRMGNTMVGVGDFDKMVEEYQACVASYNNTQLETRLTYINIPLSLRFTQPFKRFDLFAQGGLSFQILGQSRNFMDQAVPGTEVSGRWVLLPGEVGEYKPFNTALNLQTGLSMALGKRIRMDLAPGIQFSLNAPNNSQPQMQTMGSYLNCGLFYGL